MLKEAEHKWCFSIPKPRLFGWMRTMPREVRNQAGESYRTESFRNGKERVSATAMAVNENDKMVVSVVILEDHSTF